MVQSGSLNSSNIQNPQKKFMQNKIPGSSKTNRCFGIWIIAEEILINFANLFLGCMATTIFFFKLSPILKEGLSLRNNIFSSFFNLENMLRCL